MNAMKILHVLWLRFLRLGVGMDIAMLKDQQERIRIDLYDLEARHHALEVDLMQLEGNRQ